MSKKQIKFVIYMLLGTILSSIIYISPLNSNYVLIPLFLLYSVYFMFNYFNDINYHYERELYILWLLVTIVYNMFFFDITNIIISIIMFIILLVQFINMEKKRRSKKIVKEEIIKEEKKIEKKKIDIECDIDELENIFSKLYIDMQTHFMNYNYDKLKTIISNDLYKQYEKQMKHLENTNKRAIRENIIINSIEILDFKLDGNISVYKVKIDVLEDKYTISINSNNNKVCRYNTVYLLSIKNGIIDNLMIKYSKSI